MDRKSTNERNLVIKVKHHDTLRRFGVIVHGEAIDIDMAKMKEKIIGLFKFMPNVQLVLTYTDEDGDTVTLDNDEELRDAAVTQCLNPLRINVQLISADQEEGLVREHSDSPRVVTQLYHINSALSELLKSVPKPLLGTVTRVSNDVVSKAASASPLMAEIFDQISKLGFSTGGQPSQAHGGSSVTPEVASACPKDFSINDKPDAASEAISNHPVKKHDKHSESGNLTQAAHLKTANRVDVGEFGGMQNKASNDLLSSDWTVGNMGYERGLGGHQDRKGKAVTDADVSAPPLAGPSEDKQSPNSGTPVVYDESFDKISKKSPFSSALETSHFPLNAQTAFPGFTGMALSDVPLPDDFTSPIHPHRRARHYDNGSRTFHRGIRCDGCGMHPIMGPRFKSKMKEDYDLCGICFVEMGNETDYTRIDRAPYHSPRLSKEPYNHLPRHRPVRGCILRPYKMKLESCFIKDVTVLDETVIPPSSPFTKIWRMRNNGTVAWPYGTRLVWIGGNHQLGTHRFIQLEIPASGYPVDEELDIPVDCVSPSRPGRYISYWRMASPSGEKFGQRVWVLIQVDNSQPSTGGSYNPPINLNLPPETIGLDGVRIIDVNAEPQEDAASVNGMMDELVNPFANEVAVQMSEPAPVDILLGMDNGNGFIRQPMPAPVPPTSYPIIDLAAFSTVESAGETAGSTPQDNPLEQALLKELEEMGFKQIDLNKEVLRLNEYDLEQSLDDLCGFAEWDPVIEELQAMGFNDKQKNKKLLIKNGGSIKRAVLDLIAGEKPE